MLAEELHNCCLTYSPLLQELLWRFEATVFRRLVLRRCVQKGKQKSMRRKETLFLSLHLFLSSKRESENQHENIWREKRTEILD